MNTFKKIFSNVNFALLTAASTFAVSIFISPSTFSQTIENASFQKIETNPNYLTTESTLNPVVDATLEEMREKFAAPGKNFASGPLWVWNDLLTETQIRSTLQDLAKQGVKQAFVHPRPGLMTPYLSDDWFALWNAALDEARKLDMNIWIYDENSYPSGFAGGFVPDAFPESRGTGLDVDLYGPETDPNAWKSDQAVLYVFEELGDGTVLDRTQEFREINANISKSTNCVRWTVARIRYAGASQWYGGKTYVDLMRPGVFDAFVHFTHEKYREKLGDEFGKLIPGAFTDEPQIAPAGTYSWTEDFPQEFEKRRGYSILLNLTSLAAPIGDWKKIRYDYYRTALEIYVERWHRPLASYCENNGLEYTGHDWEHEWPNAHVCPDNMATAFWRHRPAIDLLMNNFSRGTHSQFGNVRSVRELSSVANQSGRSRTLSENYGAGGYDLRFEDMKRLGDWSYALGVNTTDEHLSYITIRGARKHDHPQTFSYHSKWFEQYSKMENYWTRLSYLLSQGRLSEERFLLLEPTTTAWFYQRDAGAESKKLAKIGNEFADLLNKLEAAQLDYDLGSEDIISRIASIYDANGVPVFRVGAASYRTVVLPTNLENLNKKTFELLVDFARKGGRVVSLGANVDRIDGTSVVALPQDQKTDFQSLSEKIETLSLDELTAESRAAAPVAVVANFNADNVFHLTRQTNDSRIVFLCNIDESKPANVELQLENDWTNAGIEIFDPQTGVQTATDATVFELSPCGSLALVISNKITKTANSATSEPFAISPWSRPERVAVKPLDDNVLVLDYLTLTAGGETLENEYFYRANAWLWRKNDFATSPWDNGVQFKDDLLKHVFADDSGFEVVYRFVKSDAEISDLRFVVENPDDFEVYCNGTKIEKKPNVWKFDRSFGVFDVAKFARTGENEIRLVAPKMTIFSELMPAWIVGSFSLEPRDVGFEIVAFKELAFDQKIDAKAAEPTASDELERVSWLSSGVDFGAGTDRAPQISFEFPNAQTVDAIRVWNYCERNFSKRGIKNFSIPEVGEFELRRGDGTAQTIQFNVPLQVVSKQELRFIVKSNWNGLEFPLPETFVGTTAPAVDNGFVGLADIQFLTKTASGELVPIEGVRASASSELVLRGHERRAAFAVDGSGLEYVKNGWASQGFPFYSGAVDYSFNLKKSEIPTDRRVVFELPGLRERWNGAVAAILVNGTQIGAIAFPNETVDLTETLAEALKDVGPNAEVEITTRVYGTPKNQFGPHHAGKLRGSAWPGSFHGAPATPPSGRDYDVIEYGLFSY